MKSSIRLVAINVAVLLVSAIVGELIFGNWIFGPDYRELNIPRNTSRVFDVENLYTGGGQITYTRDEHGLRGDYNDVSEIDILTLGGSTTNQLYVDDNKTWHAVLARLFAENGKSVSVVNAGVDGQSSRGHIAVFDRWFPEVEGLSSRFVLVYAGINDIGLSGAQKYDDMRSPDPARRFAAWVKNKSAIYAFYRTIRGIIAARQADVVHGSGVLLDATWQRWKRRDALPLDPPEGMRERLQGFEDRLASLAERIREFGSQPIFVTQPSAEYRFDGDWISLPANDPSIETRVVELYAFNAAVMKSCRTVRAICIDVAGNVAFEDGDFYDRIHNTDQGTAKIAAYLYEALDPAL